MMEYEDFIKQLKRHEGFRNKVYLDTEGIPTGGWGHAFIVGSNIPVEAAEMFLRHDLKSVQDDYESLDLPIDVHDTVREYVIKNMLFNLGIVRLRGFKKMLAAVRSGDYKNAAREMRDSKWARQVKGRAIELSEMMSTGEYDGYREE
ncbi:MAG: glycoside hydrolase [Desulfobacteraceae bacterium]|nr:glycoside hydrolase [Desulfobacteraceae bacterium]